MRCGKNHAGANIRCLLEKKNGRGYVGHGLGKGDGRKFGGGGEGAGNQSAEDRKGEKERRGAFKRRPGTGSQAAKETKKSLKTGRGESQARR